MILAFRILGTLIALAIGGVSVAMTFSFGLVFSDTAERYQYAALFALLDGAKLLLPTLAAYLAVSGLTRQGRTARFLYVFFAILSASSHVGLTLFVKDRESAGTNSSQTRLQDAIAARDAVRDEIVPLKSTRSAGKITADIEKAERDVIFTDPTKSAGCSNDTAPASRTHCDAWRKLKGERDDRKKLDQFSAKLDEAQQKVDTLNTADTLKKANVMAASIAKATGWNEATVLLAIAIIMALGIEFGSSIMLELVTAAGHRKPVGNVPHSESVGASAYAEPAPSTIPTPLNTRNGAEPRANGAPEPAEPTLPVMSPKQWVASRLRPNKRTSIPYETVLEIYKNEAEAAGMTPATDNAFSRALTTHGYERKRPGGVTTIMSAQMRTDRPALAVVRA
jgi:hypothetical protein